MPTVAAQTVVGRNRARSGIHPPIAQSAVSSAAMAALVAIALIQYLRPARISPSGRRFSTRKTQAGAKAKSVTGWR